MSQLPDASFVNESSLKIIYPNLEMKMFIYLSDVFFTTFISPLTLYLIPFSIQINIVLSRNHAFLYIEIFQKYIYFTCYTFSKRKNKQKSVFLIHSHSDIFQSNVQLVFLFSL